MAGLAKRLQILLLIFFPAFFDRQDMVYDCCRYCQPLFIAHPAKRFFRQDTGTGLSPKVRGVEVLQSFGLARLVLECRALRYPRALRRFFRNVRHHMNIFATATPSPTPASRIAKAAIMAWLMYFLFSVLMSGYFCAVFFNLENVDFLR